MYMGSFGLKFVVLAHFHLISTHLEAPAHTSPFKDLPSKSLQKTPIRHRKVNFHCQPVLLDNSQNACALCRKDWLLCVGCVLRLVICVVRGLGEAVLVSGTKCLNFF